MLLSLLCRYWTISLLFYLWHSSIGFWHHFNGKSTQLHLYKMNIPSVSEILSTCRLLEWPISWTLLYPHYHRTTFMSTTRSSWRSTWRWLSFPKLGWEKNPNLICSKLKKKKQNPLLEQVNNQVKASSCGKPFYALHFIQLWLACLPKIKGLLKSVGPL